MSREQFDKHLLLYSTNATTAPGNITIRGIATHFYDVRQPEIDALKYDNSIQKEACRAFGRLVSELKDEKAALKAEVERLRKDAERSCPHNNKECVYESDDGESERWRCNDCGERWSVEMPQ